MVTIAVAAPVLSRRFTPVPDRVCGQRLLRRFGRDRAIGLKAAGPMALLPISGSDGHRPADTRTNRAVRERAWSPSRRGFAKDRLLPEAPRDRLSCHARCPGGTGAVWRE